MRLARRRISASSGLASVEIFGGEQHAAEQQGGVDRRQFGGLEPVARFHVDEVVEEALVAGDAGGRGPLRRIGEEAQRRRACGRAPARG